MAAPIITAATVVTPTIWNTLTAFLGFGHRLIGTASTAVQLIDDFTVAAQAQSSIIRDTSLNDVAIKRIDLEDRIAARLAKQDQDIADSLPPIKPPKKK